MEDIKEDKIANDIIEGLPPSFMVFGKSKDLNPMEEFWMNKLTNIEKQYDEHIIDLERKLLSERATRRKIKKQTGKISKLEESFQKQTEKLDGVTAKTKALKKDLKEKEYEAKSLQQKLDRASTVQKNILKRMEDERRSRIQFEKECAKLKNTLKKMEKERGQLLIDVEIKENEKARVEEREGVLHKEKWTFVKHLTDVDTERRIQTNVNMRLCQDVEKLLGVEKSLEMGLLKERQVMGELMEEMKFQREEHKRALRQLDLTIKEKGDVDEVLQNTLKAVKERERDVKNWKEELEDKEKGNFEKNLEIRDLKRRNSKIRCVLADTRHKLNGCLSTMKALENEKRRTDVELESAKRHEKSLQLEAKRNELRKYKLAEKILKAHPFLMMNREGRSIQGSRRESAGGSSGVKKEIEGYKKQIWKLERSRDDAERRLRELQRKENVYRIKMDKYGQMEKQIFWTGKAMAKMEGDRQRLEQILHTMDSNMPVKVPFKKLVTDPSVLDRLAKNKILQKRLHRQTEKMEELKSNARRLLQFREEEFGMGNYQEEIPMWKMSYWNRQGTVPENILCGLQIDLRKEPKGPLSIRSITEDSNYKNYLQHLEDEIPKLRDEIDFLERKQNYIEMEKENEESRKRKAKEIAEERNRLIGLLLEDELPPGDAAGAHEDDEGESDSGGGVMTPDMTIHGSSFDDKKKAATESVKGAGQDEKKEKKIVVKPTQQHSVDDDYLPTDDDAPSSEAASDIPTD